MEYDEEYIDSDYSDYEEHYTNEDAGCDGIADHESNHQLRSPRVTSTQFAME